MLNIESSESDELYNELHQIFNQIRERNQQRTREQDLLTSVEDIIQRYIKGYCELPDRKIRSLKKALYTYEPQRGAKLNNLLGQIIGARAKLRKEKQKFLQQYQQRK